MASDLGFVPLPARCYPCLAERRAGSFADRIGKLALVDQRGARAAAAQAIHQFTQAVEQCD
jgi:hypothetical protein